MLEQIPGLREALEREQFNRDAAFLGLSEVVCGVELRPLTMMDVLRLRAIGSPFVVGGAIEPADVGAFFKLQSAERGKLARWRMLRKLGKKHSLAQSARAIQSFIEEAFDDAPATSGTISQSYYSGAACIVDCLGAEYGWTRSESLNTPLRLVFQYIRIITHRNHPEAVLFNPSDKVRGQWLAEQNAKN